MPLHGHDRIASSWGTVFDQGTTVPSDDATGYTPGCLFVHTDGSGATSLYKNDGTVSLCSFSAIPSLGATQTFTGANTFSALVKLNAAGGAAAPNALLMGVGSWADPATTATSDARFIQIIAETTATGGSNRLMELEHIISGTRGGTCLSTYSTVKANATQSVHGTHSHLEFLATAGASECSGLGTASRGTLHIPNVASWAPTGTYAAGMFEIYSEGTASDPAGMTELSVLRLCNSGHATGLQDVDTDAFLFSIQGFTVGNEAANLVYVNTITAGTMNAACTEALKIKVGGNTRWIPIATAVT